MTKSLSKSKRPEYQIWLQMKKRCTNPNSPNYKRYGARGIRVCNAWQRNFDAFYADNGSRPSPELSLDRKDNNGHYSCGRCAECLENGWPMNTRWATRKQQSANQQRNVTVTYNGETLCVSEWARRASVQITASVLWRRLFVSKWDMQRALSTPSDQANEVKDRRDRVRITVDGVSYFAKDWARISGVPYSTVYYHAKQQR